MIPKGYRAREAAAEARRESRLVSNEVRAQRAALLVEKVEAHHTPVLPVIDPVKQAEAEAEVRAEQVAADEAVAEKAAAEVAAKVAEAAAAEKEAAEREARKAARQSKKQEQAAQ
jgi:hypothetical protein